MSHTPPPGVPVTPDTFDTTPKARPYPELTNRELEIAYALARGLTCREIAEAIHISVKTVDTHRGHLLKKLGAKNNVVLARLMIRDGLVTP
jgi:two-component system response regulator NreC